MTNTFKTILIIGITGLILAALWLYFVVYNTGTVRVMTGVKDYSLTINEKETIHCPEDPCLLTLESGGYQIEFTKTDYYTQNQSVQVERRSDETLNFEARKIIVLRPSSYSPPAKQPAIPKQESLLGYTWNEDGSAFYYVDKEDEKLKVKKEDESESVITEFNGLKPQLQLHLNVPQNRLLIFEEESVYNVNLSRALKKKNVLDYRPETVKWSPDYQSMLIQSQSGAIYRYPEVNFENREKLELKFDLKKSDWLDNHTLVTTIANEFGTEDVIRINIPEKETETLLSDQAIRANRIIADKVGKKVYIQDNKNNQWYEMELE
jgi:hypothetical protein